MPYTNASAEWAELIETNKPRFLEKVTDLCVRKRLLLAKLKKGGRIKLKDGGGTQYHVPVKVNRASMQTLADMGPITAARVERHKQRIFYYGMYYLADSVGLKERQLTEGYKEAFVKRINTCMTDLMDDIKNQLPRELYADGYASGNQDALIGFDSATGAGTVATGDLIAMPSDTYGTLSTALGNYGGTWSDTAGATQFNATLSNDWPDGYGLDLYDFNSPKLVNWGGTAWGTGVETWAGNCERAIRTTLSWLSRNGGKPDMVLMDSGMLRDVKNYFAAERQWLPPHEEATDLGFRDTLKLDGLILSDDFDCTPGVAYMLNTDEITLRSVTDQLFWMKPEIEKSGDLSLMFVAGFTGQMDFDPKYLGRISNLA